MTYSEGIGEAALAFMEQLRTPAEHPADIREREIAVAAQRLAARTERRARWRAEQQRKHPRAASQFRTLQSAQLCIHCDKERKVFAVDGRCMQCVRIDA
jgi:hypothetical protein